eukprot:scaffold6996_cov112-Isochrysis_galbana.AAC.14
MATSRLSVGECLVGSQLGPTIQLILATSNSTHSPQPDGATATKARPPPNSHTPTCTPYKTRASP